MKKPAFAALLLAILFAACVKPPCDDQPSEWIKGKYYTDNGCSYAVIQVFDSLHYDLGEKTSVNGKGEVYLFRVDNCDFKMKGIQVGEDFYFGIIRNKSNCAVCDIMPAIFPAKHHAIAAKKL